MIPNWATREIAACNSDRAHATALLRIIRRPTLASADVWRLLDWAGPDVRKIIRELVTARRWKKKSARTKSPLTTPGRKRIRGKRKIKTVPPPPMPLDIEKRIKEWKRDAKKQHSGEVYDEDDWELAATLRHDDPTKCAHCKGHNDRQPRKWCSACFHAMTHRATEPRSEHKPVAYFFGEGHREIYSRRQRPDVFRCPVWQQGSGLFDNVVRAYEDQ